MFFLQGIADFSICDVVLDKTNLARKNFIRAIDSTDFWPISINLAQVGIHIQIATNPITTVQPFSMSASVDMLAAEAAFGARELHWFDERFFTHGYSGCQCPRYS